MSGYGSKDESESANFLNNDQAPYLRSLYQSGAQLTDRYQGKEGQFRKRVLRPSLRAFNDMLDPNQSNPYLQGQINQGLNLVNENFNENIMPGIGDEATFAGQRGGARQGVAQGIAGREALRTSADFVNNMLSQDYQAGQDRRLQAMSIAPMMGNLRYQPLQQLRELLGPAILEGESESKAVAGGGGVGPSGGQ